MLLPPPLRQGDFLMAIAPSGRLREGERERLEKGLRIWQKRGYKIILEPSCQAKAGYLAGDDQLRRRALAAAWSHPQCRGIVCV
ncbi:MAG TPA: LD-carboxypeptidase, partial [Geminocystis sp. M7585_C2015_104]|nr:LD-carboxypeptidase [Geminocystis sp. M7585_C2015_104]